MKKCKFFEDKRINKTIIAQIKAGNGADGGSSYNDSRPLYVVDGLVIQDEKAPK